MPDDKKSRFEWEEGDQLEVILPDGRVLNLDTGEERSAEAAEKPVEAPKKGDVVLKVHDHRRAR